MALVAGSTHSYWFEKYPDGTGGYIADTSVAYENQFEVPTAL